MKFKAARIHFLSEVFVAVGAVVALKNEIYRYISSGGSWIPAFLT